MESISASYMEEVLSYMADDESECSSVDSDVDSDCSTDDEALGSVSPTKTPKRRQVTFAKDVRFQSMKPRRSYKDREHEDAWYSP